MTAILSTMMMLPVLSWIWVLADMRRHSSRMNAVNIIGMVTLPFLWPFLYLAINGTRPAHFSSY